MICSCFGTVSMNGFLFVAAVLLLLQLFAALFAIGMGFEPVFIWWLFLPMVACLVGWRITRKNLDSYERKWRD